MRKATLLALAGLIALAIGYPGGSDPAPANGSVGWTTFRDRAHAFTVELPSAWKRAPSPLVTSRGDPSEILSLGSGPMPVGGGGECGFYPAAAMAAMGPRDVLISIKEDRARLKPKLLRFVPLRPRHFQVRYRPRLPGDSQPWQRYGEMNRPGEIRSDGLSPHAAWTELLFRQHGRSFRALVAIGIKASGQKREQAHRTLDSLRLRPQASGGVRAGG
jgi:hypothetical protein